VPAFTSSRRRVIAALALTSALLITLDLQGNSAVGSARRGFGVVFSPFEDAARVVSRPVENAWRGVRDYPDVADENRRLREELAQQQADHLLWLAERADYQEQAIAAGLDPQYGTPVLARVIATSPSNFDQTVTIDKGSADGLAIGDIVTVGQSLVGKITEPIEPHQSTVMLLTDVRFAVAVKVENVVDDGTQNTSPPDTAADTETTTTAPLETTAPTAPPESTEVPTGPGSVNDPLAPLPTPTVDESPDATVPTVRRNGSLQGRGADRDPWVVRVTDSARFGQTEIGAIVRTSGGANGDSLAPADLLVGTVTKNLQQAGSGGDVLEVEPAVDLTALDYVAVLRTRGG